MRAIATASQAPNRIDIFWIERDASMHHNTWDGTNWTTSSPSLGGAFVSVPAAVASIVPHRRPQAKRRTAALPQAAALDYRVDVFALRNGLCDVPPGDLERCRRPHNGKASAASSRALPPRSPGTVGWTCSASGSTRPCITKPGTGLPGQRTGSDLAPHSASEAFAISWGAKSPRRICARSRPSPRVTGAMTASTWIERLAESRRFARLPARCG